MSAKHRLMNGLKNDKRCLFFNHDVAFTPLENHALVKFIFKNNINC